MTILNTAVYRGIPGKRALTAAPFTGWLDELVESDTFLSNECELALLGERAGMHYEHPQFSTIAGAPYQFNEMLGCLWRDSLGGHLKPGETGMPLAAFMHAGSDGKPVVQALAEKAGVSVEGWLARFFDVVLPPVYHLLARHGLAFSAHGQNATVILKDGLPVRLALRDFIDDVIVCDLNFPESESLPEEVKDVLLRLPADFLMHFIQTTLFICVFRYMSVLLTSGRACLRPLSGLWQGRAFDAIRLAFPTWLSDLRSSIFSRTNIPAFALTACGYSRTVMLTMTSDRYRISRAWSTIPSSTSTGREMRLEKPRHLH